MLSNRGHQNLKRLKECIQTTWDKNVCFLTEHELDAPVDSFQMMLCVYDRFHILIEYETGMFAYKIWTGKHFEYLDTSIDEKITYGFKSIIKENMENNFAILDRYLLQKMSEEE